MGTKTMLSILKIVKNVAINWTSDSSENSPVVIRPGDAGDSGIHECVRQRVSGHLAKDHRSASELNGFVEVDASRAPTARKRKARCNAGITKKKKQKVDRASSGEKFCGCEARDEQQGPWWLLDARTRNKATADRCSDDEEHQHVETCALSDGHDPPLRLRSKTARVISSLSLIFAHERGHRHPRQPTARGCVRICRRPRHANCMALL